MARPSRRIGGQLQFAVADPEDDSTVLWCDPSVITVGCAHCGSPVGVPCMGATKYRQGTHYIRRYLYTAAKRKNFRLTEEDFKLLEARWKTDLPRQIKILPERNEP